MSGPRADSPAVRQLHERAREASNRPHFDLTVGQALDQFHQQHAAAVDRSGVGTTDPPLARYPAPVRAVGRLVARTVRVLARPITSWQREFNESAVGSLASLSECVYEQGAALLRLEAEVARLKQGLARRDRETAPTSAAVSGPVAGAATLGPAVAGVSATSGHAPAVPAHLDDVYVAFEDAFRGTREEITARQRVYLPRLLRAAVGSTEAPVLDVGCGRGEWLELLASEGLVGRGLDINAGMVAECRERGLDAEQGDLLPALAALPDGSLGAITGFHIVEHLPTAVLVALLDESLRLLRPGGVAIFETPNPANVIVGSYSFYYDPTHRNPLPAPLLKFLAEARGFIRAEIESLHPRTSPFTEEPRDERQNYFDQLFFGPMDYALIATKG